MDSRYKKAHIGKVSCQFISSAFCSSKYEDFFKVVLQLVRPADVSVQVYVHLDPKKKGVENVTRSYNFYSADAKGYDATISDVTRMRERFAEPAELSD